MINHYEMQSLPWMMPFIHILRKF